MSHSGQGFSRIPTPRRAEDEDLVHFVNKRVADLGPPVVRTYASGRGSYRGGRYRGRGGGRAGVGAVERDRSRDKEMDGGGDQRRSRDAYHVKQDDRRTQEHEERTKEKEESPRERERAGRISKPSLPGRSRPSWRTRPPEEDHPLPPRPPTGPIRGMSDLWEPEGGSASRSLRAYTPSQPVPPSPRDPTPSHLSTSNHIEFGSFSCFPTPHPMSRNPSQDRFDRQLATEAPSGSKCNETLQPPSPRRRSIPLACAPKGPKAHSWNQYHVRSMTAPSLSHVHPANPSLEASSSTQTVGTKEDQPPAAVEEPVELSTKLKFKPKKRGKGQELPPPTPPASAASAAPAAPQPAAKCPSKMELVRHESVEEDVKPTVEELEAMEVTQERPVVDDLSRPEGTLAFHKNDVPSGCYSQSKSVREESRSSFKRAQTQRLRSECRVVSNTKWRDDGVAFDWVKKGTTTVEPAKARNATLGPTTLVPPPEAGPSSVTRDRSPEKTSKKAKKLGKSKKRDLEKAGAQITPVSAKESAADELILVSMSAPSSSELTSLATESPPPKKAKLSEKLSAGAGHGDVRTTEKSKNAEATPTTAQPSSTTKREAGVVPETVDMPAQKKTKNSAATTSDVAAPATATTAPTALRPPWTSTESASSPIATIPLPTAIPAPASTLALALASSTTALPPASALPLTSSTAPLSAPAPAPSSHTPLSAAGFSEHLRSLESALDAKFTSIDKWMSIQQHYPERSATVQKQIERMEGEIFRLQEAIEAEKTQLRGLFVPA